MECYNVTNVHHNPMEERPKGLMPTTKTCQEWCGGLRSECYNAMAKRSPVYEEKQKIIHKDIESLISKHTEGLHSQDSNAVKGYIRGSILGKLFKL